MAFSSPFTEAVNCFYSALVSTLMISGELCRRHKSCIKFSHKINYSEVIGNKYAIKQTKNQ